MLLKSLIVTHTTTRNGEPLACVDNLPGPDAELTPSQLRDLSHALYLIANDCEILASAREFLKVPPRKYPMAHPAQSLAERHAHQSPRTKGQWERDARRAGKRVDVWGTK